MFKASSLHSHVAVHALYTSACVYMCVCVCTCVSVCVCVLKYTALNKHSVFKYEKYTVLTYIHRLFAHACITRSG